MEKNYTTKDLPSLYSLGRLPIYEFLEVYNILTGKYEQMRGEINNDNVDRMFDKAKRNNPYLELLTGRGRKEEYTLFVTQYHKERCDELKALANILNGQAKLKKQEEVWRAAYRIKVRLDNLYYKDAMKTQHKMSALLASIAKIMDEDSEFTNDVKTLNLTPTFTGLIESHNLFKNAFGTRTDKWQERGNVKIDVTGIRKRALDDLIKAFQMIDLEIHISGEPTFNEFMISVDRSLLPFTSLVALRTGKKKKKDEGSDLDNIDTSGDKANEGAKGAQASGDVMKPANAEQPQAQPAGMSLEVEPQGDDEGTESANQTNAQELPQGAPAQGNGAIDGGINSEGDTNGNGADVVNF